MSSPIPSEGPAPQERLGAESDPTTGALLLQHINAKFDQLHAEVVSRLERELDDCSNAREFVTGKCEHLCSKIANLVSLDAAFAQNKEEMRRLERTVRGVEMRIDGLEKKLRSLTVKD